MKRHTLVSTIAAFAAGLAVCHLNAQGAPAPTAGTLDAATLVARCAEAMGGEARIRAIRSLRVEMVYPDHGDTPVVQEIRRPNRFRSERAGSHVTVFDGARASRQRLAPGASAAPTLVPAEELADFEVEIAWLFPAFFDHPAEYVGTSEQAGARCHGLRVRLPLGATVTYFIDAASGLVKAIAAEVPLKGKTFQVTREWRDYRTVQGLRYPAGITYKGRDGATHVAAFQSVTFDPALDESRLRVQAAR